jgi:hypothetical protein
VWCWARRQKPEGGGPGHGQAAGAAAGDNGRHAFIKKKKTAGMLLSKKKTAGMQFMDHLTCNHSNSCMEPDRVVLFGWLEKRLMLMVMLICCKRKTLLFC